MKIYFNELGEYIGNKASEYFGRWYSTDIKDYTDNITTEFEKELDNNTIEYKEHIELTENGKAPLIIEWGKIEKYDNNDMIIEEIYFL